MINLIDGEYTAHFGLFPYLVIQRENVFGEDCVTARAPLSDAEGEKLGPPWVLSGGPVEFVSTEPLFDEICRCPQEIPHTVNK